jgi:glycosyltransferase involved in cell wall biosynthesis
MSIRVLHVVKTADGAFWAADEAAELVRLGVEVHVALPKPRGAAVDRWVRSGSNIHLADLSFPSHAPWQLKAVYERARSLVAEIHPDVIHSHFVSTTLSLRLALGKDHPVPRVFQVPGPLHLEHTLFRDLELSTAGRHDYWVASSLYTSRLYRRAGIAPERLFLSHYGTDVSRFRGIRTGAARRALGIPDNHLVIGNINMIYPPKYYLGQFKGLKSHEVVIDALSYVTAKRSDVTGVLFGGTSGRTGRYEMSLRTRAERKGGGRVKMPGFLDPALMPDTWPDFDCAIHVPLSENCGGVGEPLLSGVATLAARVGGLPEVVVDGVTGKLVSYEDARHLADLILSFLDDLDYYKKLAGNGRELATVMFDTRRTATEVLGIYHHILNPSLPRPREFDSKTYASAIAAGVVASRMRP